jgi:type IV secretory pathway VirB4 component
LSCTEQIHNQKFIKHHKNPLGGQAFLHGLGNKDVPIFIPQHLRTGHMFVVGTTRVGKTRLASILINQDIRNGDAVIVIDPKGDLELVRDMYAACLAGDMLKR